MLRLEGPAKASNNHERSSMEHPVGRRRSRHNLVQLKGPADRCGLSGSPPVLTLSAYIPWNETIPGVLHTFTSWIYCRVCSRGFQVFLKSTEGMQSYCLSWAIPWQRQGIWCRRLLGFAWGIDKGTKSIHIRSVRSWIRGPSRGQLRSSIQSASSLPLLLLAIEMLFIVNHSCEPNVAFDLSSPDPSKWHIRALECIEVGTPGEQTVVPTSQLEPYPYFSVTFFYPSTEWDMDQAFNCECGATVCTSLSYTEQYVYFLLIDLPWANPWRQIHIQGGADRPKMD